MPLPVGVRGTVRGSIARLRSRFGLSLLQYTLGAVIVFTIVLYIVSTLSSDRQAAAIGFEMRRNMRVVTETIERDIRRAGFMVPASGAVCAVDNVNAPDVLYLSDASVLDPEQGASGHDNGAPIRGDNVAPGWNPLWRVPLVLDDVANYDTDGDGEVDSDFARGGGVIVTDRRAPARGSACGPVVDVNATRGTIRVEIVSGILGPGSHGDLVAIPAHEYRIEQGNVLSRDGAELAGGMADLQVAFFVDTNGDNVEQLDELIGYGAGPRYVSGRVDLSNAREIRVHTVLLSRGGKQDGKVEVRRRTHTTRELLRNLVMR